MTSVKSLIRRLVLIGVALGGISIVYFTRPLYSNVGRFAQIAFAVWLAVFMIYAYRSMLFLLVARGRTFRFVQLLYDAGFIGTLVFYYQQRMLRKLSLMSRFAFWGLVIAGIVVGLFNSGALPDAEYHMYDMFPPRMKEDTTSSLRHFWISSENSNAGNYLRDLYRFVRRFRQLGAGLIFAEVPGEWRGDSMRDVYADSLSRIDSLVLFTSSLSMGRYVYPPYGQPVYQPERIVQPLRIPQNEERLRRIRRWYPYVWVRGMNQIDVALVVAARMLGVSDSAKPVAKSGAVDLGEVSIPVLSDGQAASVVNHGFLSAVLTFWGQHDADSTYLLSMKTMERVSEYPAAYAHEIQGNTIFISWDVKFDRAEFVPLIAANQRVGIVESILHGEVIRQQGIFALPLTVLMIAISGLLCLRLRLRWSVVLILLLALALFTFGAWMMITKYITLQIAYPTFAALLSAAIFPLVRLSHESPAPPGN